MSKELFKVSQSKVKLWRKCRQAYHYKYVEKLRRRRISRPFQFGRIVHSMLEAHANGDDPFKMLKKISFDNKKLFAAEREMYGEIVEDIGVIMHEYFQFYDKDELYPLRKNKRSAEHEFNIEIAKGIELTGKIDEVSKTKNKLKWLTENKTFTKLPNGETRWKNIQSVTYIRAIEMLGWWDNIAGTCWNYVKSKPPTKPKLLKSGGFSKRYVDTLPSVVISAIEEAGLKTKDYRDLIKQAEENRQHYFFRIFTPINKGVVDRIFSGFVDTAKEMSEYHGRKQDKNIDRHCDYCDYNSICRAELTGSDVDYVKEREYYRDENEKQQIDEEERETSE